MPGATSENELEDFFENGAMALHLVGPDGRILRANRAELELLGYEPTEYIGRNVADFHADKNVIRDILARLTRGEKLDRYPARLITRDGGLKDVEITSSACCKNGKFLHTRCFTADVTELRRAQQALRAKDEQLRKTLEALPAAVYTTDKDGFITYFNKAAAKFAGRTPVIGEDKWCVTFRLRDIQGNALLHDQCPMAIALKEKREVRGIQAYAERPDGTIVPFQPYPTPLFDEQGDLQGAINMLVDIADQKEREKQIEFVMRELSHRSKNLLTIVQSVAMQTIKHSDCLADFQEKFLDRIHAMARTHDLLVSNDWLGAEIKQIIRSEVRAFVQDDDRISVDGVQLRLNPSVAQSLSLAVHELTTNAIKYGALSDEHGTIQVSWDTACDAGIRFTWCEEKKSNAMCPNERRGFGTHLLTAIFDEPQFTYSAGGLNFKGVLRYAQL